MLDLKHLLAGYLDPTYAIQFTDPVSEQAGTYLVALHGPGVGLSGGVFLVKSAVVTTLRKEKINFRMEKVFPGDVSKIKEQLIRKGWNIAPVRDSRSALG